MEAAHDFLESASVPVDFIFFDLPGTVNTPGILKALAGMHHIFTPIVADRVVMESTLIFTQLMKDVIMKTLAQFPSLFEAPPTLTYSEAFYTAIQKMAGADYACRRDMLEYVARNCISTSNEKYFMPSLCGLANFLPTLPSL